MCHRAHPEDRHRVDNTHTGRLSIGDLKLAVRTLCDVSISTSDLEAGLRACSGETKVSAFAATGSDHPRPPSTSSNEAAERIGSLLRTRKSSTSESCSRPVTLSDFLVIVASLVSSEEPVVSGRVQQMLRYVNRFPEPEPLDLSLSRGVFLGGSVGEGHSWRRDRAIPILYRHGIDHFNPNLVEVFTQLTPREAQAKRSCVVLLFYISSTSRDISTMVEAAHFLGEGRAVVLCLELVAENSTVDGEWITPPAANDINRGRRYLADVANRTGTPIFDTVEDAVEQAIEMVREIRARTDASKKRN